MRFVVVALVVVEKPMESPCEKVELAPVNNICEVVAEIPAAGWVKGSPLEPEPHALALAETLPSLPTWRHLVPDPPAEEITRFVVDALVAERFVVVALVVVENPMERPWEKVEEAETRRPRVEVGASVVALFISKVFPKRLESCKVPAVATSPGPAMVFTKVEPRRRFVTVRAVVVALLVVEKPMSRPCENVEEAPVKRSCEVVAEMPAAGCVKAS